MMERLTVDWKGDCLAANSVASKVDLLVDKKGLSMVVWLAEQWERSKSDTMWAVVMAVNLAVRLAASKAANLADPWVYLWVAAKVATLVCWKAVRMERRRVVQMAVLKVGH